MASFVAGMNPAGVYNAPATGVILSDAGQVFALGDQVEDWTGNRWTFVSASGNLTTGQVVAVNSSGVAQAATSALAQTGGRCGVVQNAVSSGSYGWAQIYGLMSVVALSTTSASSAVYTTATAGSIKDTSTSQVKIVGLTVLANVTAGGGGIAAAQATQELFFGI